VAAVLLAGPWVRVCWRTEPLPDGPLRSGLLTLADRAGISVRNILVWRTNLSIANGCMIGVIGPLRYIMITDSLLLSLAPEEVEDVFAHEVAHVKYRHVVLYMLMGLVGASVAILVGEVVGAWVSSPLAMTAVVGGVIVAYWGIGFGFVSRRCEQECDLYAARATSCPVGCSPPDPRLVTGGRAAVSVPVAAAEGAGAADAGTARGDAPTPADGEAPATLAGTPGTGSLCEHRVATFTSALRRIARLNGAAETARGWRHFSIAHRCAFLAEVLRDPALGGRFERRMRGLKVVILVGVLLVGLATVALVLLGQASEPDHPEDPAGPEDFAPRVYRQLVRLVDRYEVDAIALWLPDLDRDPDAVAHLHDGRPAGLRAGAPSRHDEVAVADPGGHAVAVDAECEGAGLDGAEAGQVQELRDPVGGRRG